MAIDMKQFHQTFFDESFEGLDIMESGLLGLEVGAADNDVVNSIFRAAHSIKGGSGTFGFTDIASFTHVLETLLDQMRDGFRDVTQEAVDGLLQSVDCLRDMLNAASDEADVDKDAVAEVQKNLEAILNSEGDSSAEITRSDVSGADEVDGASTSGWSIRFTPHLGMLATGNDPARMFRVLEELGDLVVVADVSGIPAYDEFHAEDIHIGWQLTLTGDVSREQVDDVFEWVDDECDLEITELLEPKDVPEALKSDVKSAVAAPDVEEPRKSDDLRQGDRKTSKQSGAESASIRVSIDKVDDIINLVGELVITQSMLGQIGAELESDEQAYRDTARIERLREGLAQLESNTRELQESIMRVRMLPISFVFSRFPRMIHDLSSKMDKRIELVISGEQTELDKTIMEKIGDPLVHLVRNSIDHGIESPEVRVAAGKPETGTVSLNACHQGGNIVIEIRDDGKGLDREKILAKARERGLIQEDESISDEKIYDLIFQPGFSTADVVSDVSGRGVGMDVVRRNIRDLGGSVEIQSELGSGTTILIRLPLTLAILDGQLVSVGKQTYVVPLTSIIESLQIRRDQINTVVGQAHVYLLRDEYIPIIRLCDIFNIHAETVDLDGGLMVVVEGGGQKAGLVVDDLLAQQQVVIKSLETNFKRVDGLSGATILGDGTVAMILDVGGLISYSRSIDCGLIRSRRNCNEIIQHKIDSPLQEDNAVKMKMNKEIVNERNTIH
ncbi:MAG: chemotaxis protein CheA [Gammaproteobacteria bacterium]|nr:MAG: chemotaxis protein CheA [Gammaproteobacteria bacterium]